MLRTALIICDDVAKIASIFHALESEHSIWNVARQRDAMAYMARHRPDTVVIDLDMPALDADSLLDAIRDQETEPDILVIGICGSPSAIAESIAHRIDQFVTASVCNG